MKNQNWYIRSESKAINKQAGIKQFALMVSMLLSSGCNNQQQAKNIVIQKINQSGGNEQKAKQQIKKEIENKKVVKSPVSSGVSIPPYILSTLLKQQTVNGKIATKAYPDTRGRMTIGIGFNLQADNSLTTRLLKTFGYNDKDIHQIILGQKSITPQQALQLSKNSINYQLSKVKQKLPHFSNYPDYVQSAIISAFYRGDLGNKTIELINSGKWDSVSSQYLHHKNYNPAKDGKKGTIKGDFNRGVTGRMQRNAIAFDKYNNQLNKGKK